MTFDPPQWDQLGEVEGNPDPASILAAARTDLNAAAEKIEEYLGRDNPALPFRVVEIDHAGEDGPRLLVRVGSRKHDIKITATVLTRALERRVGPLELLAYAVASPVPLGANWRPRRIGHATPPNDEQIRHHDQVFRTTSAYNQVERALVRDKDVLVVGPHGAGRSALISKIARKHSRRNNHPQREFVWLDLTDPADGPESIVMALLQATRHDAFVVIVEGLQANLPVVDALFQFITRLRGEFGLTVQVLASGWQSVAELLSKDGSDKLLGKDGSFELTPVRVDARHTIDLMLKESFTPEERQRIRPLLVDDVHLAARAIDIYKRTGRVPTEEQLELEFVKPSASGAEQRAFYFLACLGVFGLALPVEEAESERFGHGVVEGLRRDGFVHRTDGAYIIGPRRRAKLVLQYAMKNWHNPSDDDTPESIVWQHLQEGGERLIRATLSQIDLVVSPERLRPESLSLLAAWERSEQLGTWIERRTRADPTWGDNLGSAVFAAIALTRLNREDLWLSIAGPIRARWSCDDPEQQQLRYQGDPTTDFADFTEIGRRMIAEDAAYGEAGHPTGIPGKDFDPERAYLNWVLGLLLCIEGTAPSDHRDEGRIRQLLDLAERVAETEGSYYPARVPFVTARIVIGLYHADLAWESNKTIKNACRWLLGLVTGDDERGGGDHESEACSWWRGGTGSWNRDEATTALCLTALILAGLREREQVTTAVTWLVGREGEWCKPDHEIDLAQVLETLSAADLPFDTYLRELLKRTLKELDAEPAVARPEEQLRLPFLAAQLSAIIWQTVHHEFLRLLSDVMHPDAPAGEAPAEESTPEPPTVTTAGPASTPATEKPCGLLPAQLESWQEACLTLSQTLAAQISNRQFVDTPSVQRGLKEKLAQRDRYVRLREKLTTRAPRTVLTELDELGETVCGQTWPPLPYPERYCDDDSP